MTDEVSESAVALAGLLRVCEPPSAALALFVGQGRAGRGVAGVLARRAPRAVVAATAARTQDVTAEVLIRRARGGPARWRRGRVRG